MDWSKLKDCKCPTCDVLLKINAYLASYECMKCNFSISFKKFNKIIKDVYKKEERVLEDNMSELNNFDRPVVSEDFSDSPHLDY